MGLNSSRTKRLAFLFLFSLALQGCTNIPVVTPISDSDPLLIHRWFALGAAFIFGFAQLTILTNRNVQPLEVHAENKATTLMGLTLIWTILGLSQLMWTGLGQWTYLFMDWLFSLWNPLVCILGLLNGIGGNIGLCVAWIILLGFIFPVATLFYWTVLPTLAGLLINLFVLSYLNNNKL